MLFHYTLTNKESSNISESTVDKTRQGYTVYRMMHQALDDSDQTRKYGISESIIQALIMTLLQPML